MTQNSSIRFELLTEQSLLPKSTQTQRILELNLQSPPSFLEQRRLNLNISLIIDRSGSMQGPKLEAVKTAAAYVIDLLRDADRVSLIAFDDHILTLAPSTLADPQARANLKQTIQQLAAGNMTNLGDGWLTGCQQIAAHLSTEQINRALLLTDGLANVGMTDPEEIWKHASELHQRGISTSTFGVGEGFNEHLLEPMANRGGGNYYYIDHPRRIQDIFLRELSELLNITAKGVEIQLEFPANVSVEVLGDWRKEEAPGKLCLYPGDLAANQTRMIYFKVLTPPMGTEPHFVVTARLRAQAEDGTPVEQTTELSFRYAEAPDLSAASPLVEVLERFNRMEMAETTNEALKLERMGKREEAGQMLYQAVMAASPYLPEQEIDKYQSISERMRHGMNEHDRKRTQFASAQQRKSRPQEPDEKI